MAAFQPYPQRAKEEQFLHVVDSPVLPDLAPASPKACWLGLAVSSEPLTNSTEGGEGANPFHAPTGSDAAALLNLACAMQCTREFESAPGKRAA